MGSKQNAHFTGKITLDCYIMSFHLTVIQNKTIGSAVSPIQCITDEQNKEIFNYLKSIAHELIFGDLRCNNEDEGEIKTFSGKHVKLAYCICKESSKLTEGEPRSYLVPNSSQGEQLTFKKMMEFDRYINASVYFLRGCEQRVDDVASSASNYSHTETVLNVKTKPMSKDNERLTTLDKFYSKIKPETTRPSNLREETLLQEAINNLDTKIKTRSQHNDEKGDDPAKVNSEHVREKRMKALTVEEIGTQFEKWRSELIAISKGKFECQRHADYMKGGSAKRKLDGQLYTIRFSDNQINCATTCLKSIYANHQLNGGVDSQSLDYILRVLLPEFLARICMDVRNIEYEAAEKKLSGYHYGHSSGEESEAFMSDAADIIKFD